MTISTEKYNRPGQTAGFTLLEALVATALSPMLLAAVLSSITFLSRSSFATADYAVMDREARDGLEKFARDVRMADAVSNFSTNSVRLRVPTSGSPYTVDYTYVPDVGAFYRAYGTPQQELLISGIETFALKRYTLQQTPASNDLETKQLQLELRATRMGPAKAFASNNVVSARYVLRNKAVSN